MKVTYNGFTGELVKLEATYLSKSEDIDSTYNLVIFDRGKRVECSFRDVKLADVKFIGGTATMSGTINIGEVTFK